MRVQQLPQQLNFIAPPAGLGLGRSNLYRRLPVVRAPVVRIKYIEVRGERREEEVLSSPAGMRAASVVAHRPIARASVSCRLGTLEHTLRIHVAFTMY